MNKPARKPTPPGVHERRKHAKRTGEVIISWNLLQTTLQVMFCAIVATTDRDDRAELGKRIWMALQADSAQRDILRVSIPVCLAKHKAIRERALWAIKVTDALSALRNDFTHTPINFSQGKIVPHVIGATQKRIDRMSVADIRKIQRLLTGDLNRLNAFALRVVMHYTLPQQHSLPKIPRLQIPSVYPDLKSKLRFLPTPKARGTRSRASRP